MKALVIGGAAWDTLIHIDELNELQSDMNLWANKVIETVGGTGAGKALALSALGADVTLVAEFGDNVFFNAIMNTSSSKINLM